MAVMALRERKDGGRTLAAAVPGEQASVAWHLVRNHVLKGAELRADQNPAYDELVGLHPAGAERPLRCVRSGAGIQHEPGRELLFAGPASGGGLSTTVSRASISTGTPPTWPGARTCRGPISAPRPGPSWLLRCATATAGTWRATGSGRERRRNHWSGWHPLAGMVVKQADADDTVDLR